MLGIVTVASRPEFRNTDKKESVALWSAARALAVGALLGAAAGLPYERLAALWPVCSLSTCSLPFVGDLPPLGQLLPAGSLLFLVRAVIAAAVMAAYSQVGKLEFMLPGCSSGASRSSTSSWGAEIPACTRYRHARDVRAAGPSTARPR